MAITQIDTRNSYSGNSSITTIYPITFKYFDSSYVTVYAAGVDITSDVSFTGDGNDKTGGFQTPLVAYDNAVEVVAVLDMVMDQSTVLIEGGLLPAKTIEESGFDRLNMQIRTNLRAITNSLRSPDYEAGMDVIPIAALRANKVLGFDDFGQPLLALLDTLNSAAALDAAVLEAAASAAAALASELAAAASAAAALISELNAYNSAISAKGYITITALPYVTIPTGYPVDQMSAMAVSTAVEGGEWEYPGMVTTHVFTNIIGTFDVTYLQIYAPDENNALGSWTKVRHGLTGGTTWSEWGEWNDALSRSQGGTVSGTLLTDAARVQNEGEQVLSARYIEEAGWARTRTDINPEWLTLNTVGAPTPTVITTKGYAFVDTGSLAAAEAVNFDIGRNVSINTASAGVYKDIAYGWRGPAGSSAINVVFRLTYGDIASPFGELVATDNGIQFMILRNGSGTFVRVLLAHTITLFDSGDIPALWLDGDGHIECVTERDGSMSIWTHSLFGEKYLLYRENGFLHPWVEGVSLSPVKATLTYTTDTGAGAVDLSHIYENNITNT